MTNNIHAALERLLPCPFCGGEATLNDHRLLWVVHCSSCSACVMGNQAPEPEEESPESYWEPFRQSAVDNWNRRAALATEVGEGPSDEEWDALVERVWGQYETVGNQGERFMYDSDFGYALDIIRKELTSCSRRKSDVR